MPDEKSEAGAPANAAFNVAQEGMKQYQQWMNSYQQLLTSAMSGANMGKVGLDHWQRQMELAKALTEASLMIAKATGDYVQACMAQSTSGWKQVAEVTTSEVMEQQERIRQRARASS